MKSSRHYWTLGFMLLAISVGTYALFDYYVSESAEEIVNTILRNERTAIQQGNLLKSITKLQTVVETSEQLTGVAVYDPSMDPDLKYPLLLVGNMVSLPKNQIEGRTRIGLFDNLYVRRLGDQKLLIFLFRPRWILWTFICVNVALVGLMSGVAYLSGRFERIHQDARAAALVSVYEQVSHDVKSPLSALQMISQVMKSDEFVSDLLRKSIVRIEGIVSDLEVRSQMAVSGELGHERFVVSSAITDVIQEKRLIHPEVDFQWTQGFLVSALGNEEDFKRVISNVLNNAIEATSENCPISVSLSKSGSNGVLTVQDRGTGIPLHVQNKLFRRGFTFGKSGGQGLGLSHARKVIREMNGDIQISSELDVGTIVTIEIPTRAERA